METTIRRKTLDFAATFEDFEKLAYNRSFLLLRFHFGVRAQDF